MSVFELALASAISRRADLGCDEELLGVVSDWFLRPVRHPDAMTALDRMVARGWVEHDGTLHGARLTETGVETFTQLYGGCIRMIDRGLGLMRVGTMLSLFEQFGLETKS